MDGTELMKGGVTGSEYLRTTVACVWDELDCELGLGQMDCDGCMNCWEGSECCLVSGDVVACY